MFSIRSPLSGDVTQDIAPSIGGQLGLLNINTSMPPAPATRAWSSASSPEQ
jgi:hypothetical protein